MFSYIGYFVDLRNILKRVFQYYLRYGYVLSHPIILRLPYILTSFFYVAGKIIQACFNFN